MGELCTVESSLVDGGCVWLWLELSSPSKIGLFSCFLSFCLRVTALTRWLLDGVNDILPCG